jgi:hypothetical protein
MHVKRCYVKSKRKTAAPYPAEVRRLALPLALLALWAGAAKAEVVYRGGPVSDARLAVPPEAQPVVAYVANGTLTVAVRGALGWESRWPFVLPARNVELDGLVVTATGLPTVLLRDREGRWLAVARSIRAGQWRWHAIRPDGKTDVIGPGGLALDLNGRPVVAYALWHPSHKTALRVVRVDGRGVYRTQPVTRKGFPATPTLAGAAPVVMPNGQIRVVETFEPAAIEWRPIPGDWIGQFLHGSALGVPTGSIAAAVSGSTVYAAWTEAFPTLGPPAVVLAAHGAHADSTVAIENAVLAAMALTPAGPELAANRCVTESSCLGLVGDAGVDGLVAGYAAETGGSRQLLLASDDGLDWLRSPLPLAVHVSLNKDLTGRVQGASGGAVTLYREAADGSRASVGTFAVAPDGSFAGADRTSATPPPSYRVVWTDPATSIPYCAVVATGS